MMYMSGTSVAAPIVAGAAALLLQTNAGLTPALVKAILMYTTQPLAHFNRFEQGSGLLNIDGAVRLAQCVATDLSKKKFGSSLLVTSVPAPQSTVAGETFQWAQNIGLDHTFLTGVNLITYFQKVYGRGMLLSDGVIEGYDTQSLDTSLMTSGIMVGDGIMVRD